MNIFCGVHDKRIRVSISIAGDPLLRDTRGNGDWFGRACITRGRGSSLSAGTWRSSCTLPSSPTCTPKKHRTRLNHCFYSLIFHPVARAPKARNPLHETFHDRPTALSKQALLTHTIHTARLYSRMETVAQSESEERLPPLYSAPHISKHSKGPGRQP